MYDETLGRRVNRLKWNEGGFLNFQNANLAFSSSFRSKQRSGNTDKTPRSTSAPLSTNDEAARLTAPGGYNDYLDFNIPWSLNVAYILSLNRLYRPTTSGGDTLTFTHSAQFSGDFSLTPHLKFTFSSGYDLSNHQLSITSIDIYRDLHCFEMRLGTIPFGPP